MSKLIAPLALALSALSLGQVTVTHHSGLSAPVSTTLINDAAIGAGFLIAELGTGNGDGRVTFLEDGTNARHEVVVGLPSDIDSEGFPSGCHDVLLTGSDLYVAIGNTVLPLGYKSVVLRYDLSTTPWVPGSRALTLGDAADVINVRHFVQNLGYADTNVYALAEGKFGHIGIVDSGANSLLKYNPNTGGLAHVVEFPKLPNPIFPIGPPEIDPVPTKVRFDGQRMQVSTLTGFPFLPGLAKIYRVAGDGTLTVVQEGLTLVTDFDFDPADGGLVVSEFSAGFDLAAGGFVPNSGSVVKIDGNGDRVYLSRDNDFLTTMQLGNDAKPYFGSIATGELYRIEAGSMNYCEATANSVGSGAMISHSGSVSVGANDLALTCTAMPANAFSLALMGTTSQQVPLSDGYLCIGGPKLFRLELLKSSASGSLFYPVDNTDLPNGASIEPGETRNFQVWYRDQGFGANENNFSNGLQILFLP